jgi:hypothetical protein
MQWPEKYITITEKFSTEDFFKHFIIILFWILYYFISIEFPQNIMPYDKIELTNAKQTMFIGTILISNRPQISQTCFKDNSIFNVHF